MFNHACVKEATQWTLSDFRRYRVVVVRIDRRSRTKDYGNRTLSVVQRTGLLSKV